MNDVTILSLQRRNLSGPDMNLFQYMNVLLPIHLASVTVDSLEGLFLINNAYPQ